MQTILVIEDSPLVLKVLQHQFQQESELQPIFCASLAEAEVVLETFAGQLFAALALAALDQYQGHCAADLASQW